MTEQLRDGSKAEGRGSGRVEGGDISAFGVYDRPDGRVRTERVGGLRGESAMTEPAKLELVIHGDVARLHLGPDDIVILRLKTPARPEDLERAIQTMRTLLDRAGHKNEVLAVDAERADVEVVGPES